MNESPRLIGLRAENFMRLRVVEQTFENGAPVIRICGRNDQGKTSFIEAIACALGGEKLAPKVPIRRGADEAEVTVQLSDLIVTRKWRQTEEGIASTLTVKSPDGMKHGSPQKLLNALIGELSFDPLAFTRSEPKKQVETLKQLVGLDFTILNVQRKTHFDNRTAVNAEVKGLRALVDGIKLVNAPDEPVDVAQLLKEQAAAIEEQRRYDGLRRAAEEAQRDHARAQTRVLDAKAALAKAQKDLEEATAAEVKAQEREEEAAGEFAVAVKPGLDAIREQLVKAQETNELVRQKKSREEAGAKLYAKEREAADLTEKIEGIDQRKRDALSAAKFPVAGLSFTDDRVTLNGVPFEQASQANQIRVSLAIGLALNPRLKLVLIRDGSLLDADMMRVVAEMAQEAGAQVLIERVLIPGEVGVVIEDGLVVNEKAA
jgi:DNA repair exonuclease SbcCD ATPase subunit